VRSVVAATVAALASTSITTAVPPRTARGRRNTTAHVTPDPSRATRAPRAAVAASASAESTATCPLTVRPGVGDVSRRLARGRSTPVTVALIRSGPAWVASSSRPSGGTWTVTPPDRLGTIDRRVLSGPMSCELLPQAVRAAPPETRATSATRRRLTIGRSAWRVSSRRLLAARPTRSTVVTRDRPDGRALALAAVTRPGTGCRRARVNESMPSSSGAALTARGRSPAGRAGEDVVIGGLRAPGIVLDDTALARLDEIFPGPGGPAPEPYAW